MFKLALIVSNLLFISAKLSKQPDFWYIEYFNEVEEPLLKDLAKDGDGGAVTGLWVLDLDDSFELVRLRSGSQAEEDEFEDVIGPMIDSFLSKQSKQNKQSKVRKATAPEDKKDNNYSKREIMKIINKFLFTADAESQFDISQSGPSLTLYFKGPFTSLMLRHGKKQWHYFIGPPSPLPAWFYTPHDHAASDGPAMYVEVPDDVKQDFLTALLDMLRMFLSFPV